MKRKPEAPARKHAEHCELPDNHTGNCTYADSPLPGASYGGKRYAGDATSQLPATNELPPKAYAHGYRYAVQLVGVDAEPLCDMLCVKTLADIGSLLRSYAAAKAIVKPIDPPAIRPQPLGATMPKRNPTKAPAREPWREAAVLEVLAMRGDDTNEVDIAALVDAIDEAMSEAGDQLFLQCVAGLMKQPCEGAGTRSNIGRIIGELAEWEY